jgi:histidine ammonia-lyase
VLENRTLSSPDTVHSLPTSANQEDHNANSFTAALHANQVVKNTTRVLAIELYCAARALTLRLKSQPDLQPGVGTAAALAFIRRQVPYQASDTLWGPEIDRVEQMIKDRTLSRAVSESLQSAGLRFH